MSPRLFTALRFVQFATYRGRRGSPWGGPAAAAFPE